eukprot:gene10257-12008_t
MSNPIGATQESLEKLYEDVFTKKGPKDVLVNATTAVIQDQYLRKEDEGGIYCIKIVASTNYEDRYEGHGFKSEAVFEINGDHLMENWLLRRIPGSVRDAFVGKGAKVGAVLRKLGFHYTDKSGPSPGPTEWRIVTGKFFEKLESMNQGNDWLKKMNNFNYRSEFRELASGVAGSGDGDFPSYSLLFPAETLKIIRHVPDKPATEGGKGGIPVGKGAAAVRVKREIKLDGKYFESITRTEAQWKDAWTAGETEYDDLQEIDFHHVDSDDKEIAEEVCDEENVESAEGDADDSEDNVERKAISILLGMLNTRQTKIVIERKTPSLPSQPQIAYK